MNLLRSAAIAFSMYSRIPMPRVEWNEESRKYVLLLFPLVGVAEGVLEYALFCLLRLFQVSSILSGALLMALPYAVVGFIHLDGFLDTADALGSFRTREERLRILKDVHTGSAAVLSCVILCIFQTAAWAGIRSPHRAAAVCAGFVLSRALSALSLTVLPNARGKESSVALFTDSAKRNRAARRTWIFCLSLWIVLSAVFMAASFLRAAGGAGVLTSSVLPLAEIFCGLFCMFRMRSTFGGMTGDLAGFLLTVCEMIPLLLTALFG